MLAAMSDVDDVIVIMALLLSHHCDIIMVS